MANPNLVDGSKVVTRVYLRVHAFGKIGATIPPDKLEELEALADKCPLDIDDLPSWLHPDSDDMANLDFEVEDVSEK